VREGGERELEPPVVLVPAQFSEFAPVVVGTVIWALLFAIGLVLRPTLADDGREWWVWSAAAGVGLGLIGYLYLRRRQARLLARADASAQPAPEPTAEPKTPDQS
jgi:hypothetical protein